MDRDWGPEAEALADSLYGQRQGFYCITHDYKAVMCIYVSRVGAWLQAREDQVNLIVVITKYHSYQYMDVIWYAAFNNTYGFIVFFILKQ